MPCGPSPTIAPCSSLHESLIAPRNAFKTPCYVRFKGIMIYQSPKLTFSLSLLISNFVIMSYESNFSNKHLLRKQQFTQPTTMKKWKQSQDLHRKSF